MAKSSADSTHYPDDESLLTAITDLPLYGRLAQYKVRTILEALAFAYTPKSEVQLLSSGLTLEHVMPQAWKLHWPLPEKEKISIDTGEHDLIKEQKLSSEENG